jgi:hypothetical protein
MALNHSCQSSRHKNDERGLDLYSTPAVAVEALLKVEKLPHWIWEPAAGRGAIANVLRAHGHAVVCSDIARYDFDLHFVGDFLLQTKAPARCTTIITNPPFNIINKFAAHALDLAPNVYVLARLAFLESVKRTDVLERHGLRRVHVFRQRLPMMHRDSWKGRRASSAICFAWFCWSRGHRGPTIVDRIGGGT